MQTDELIADLAAGAQPAKHQARQRLAVALGAALAGCFGVMMLGWGVRPDLPQALGTAAFWMKAAYAAAVAVAGVALIERLGRPAARPDRGWKILIVAVAVIVLLALAELALTPRTGWRTALLGESWRDCPWRIAVIAAPAFATALWFLRRMAPTRLRLAGAAAGVMAGGIGATVYGLACQETAATFTAVWYSLGMSIWALVGAVLGERLLRW